MEISPETFMVYTNSEDYEGGGSLDFWSAFESGLNKRVNSFF